MRIPASKVYRAFPELDRFSDEQCEMFMRRVKDTDDFKNVTVWIGLAGATGFLVFIVLVSVGFEPVTKLMGIWMSIHRAYWLSAAVCAFVLFSGTGIAGLIGRDQFLRRELKHAIWRKIERIRCERCKYSLLGQRAPQGLVHCPECGATTSLRSLGLANEADLIPPDAAASATIAG